jgi:integrase
VEGKKLATRERIGLRDIRQMNPGDVIWDSAVIGFGARRQKSEAISYVLIYRTHEGRQRWHTIGRHGAPWTPDTARDEAKRLLGDVAHGADPAMVKRARRQAATVAELCDLYIADVEAGRLLTRRKVAKKASTLATDRFRINRHIKPLLGQRKVAAVALEDVDQFMHEVAAGKTAILTKTPKEHGLARARGGKGTASRTVGLLGAIFTYAVRNRMRPDNPVRGVLRFADGKRNRRLNDDEYKAFGQALRRAEVEGVWPATIAAARFLAVTGWRSGEAMGLRRADIDLARRTATLPDTKTGRSIRPLSKAACDVLQGFTLMSDGHLVFPAMRGGVLVKGFWKQWGKIAALGDLSAEITPHTLRHSFASLAADLGYSEPTIAALIGHKGQSVTSRYVHAADAVLLVAADAVANRTAELMGERTPGGVVVELRKASS